MSSHEPLPRAYEPAAVEAKWFPTWEKAGNFHGEPNPDKKPYSIVIPPPNVTGILTLGHVLNNTLQDILCRYHRMKGEEVCWFPGTDHAGIATEARVEKYLRKEENTGRDELGREEFIRRVWQWKGEFGGKIIRQLRTLGCSCDWERERFTMDEGLSEAVKKVFVELYNKGYIYRGQRMINWCPVAKSALSDEEVIYKDVAGHFWHFRYPLADGSGYLVVATTRPETMFGDTAVAVNPADERYKHLIGRMVKLPLTDREIPIIGDEHADPAKGTGCVKITPAHDPNDFEVGKRHNLEVINVMNPDASLNARCGAAFEGLDRFEARKLCVKMMEEQGLLEKVEEIRHAVGYSERGDVPIETLVSYQWFCNMKELAKPAIEAVKSGRIKFYPERWSKTYFHWMENIQDWCISRQIWWGHRIPAWYNDENGEVYVGLEAPTAPGKWRQEEDVLDTWFSSWLWPFSIMGWPKETPELKYFYPTCDLVTGPDIIFFWVARMIMAGYEYRGEKPFGNVYFTGIVRDKIGRKMSKQLGNSPDPLDLIAKYGADGMRMAMLISSSAGNDVMFDEALCEQGRNFGNKIWNAYRLVNGWSADGNAAQDENNRLAVAWFRQTLGVALRQIADDFGCYRISEAFKTTYKLFWDDFSGLYLEMVKPAYGQPIDAPTFEATRTFFDSLMRVLHPFMPFVTEEIWQDLAPRKEGESITVAPMPQPDEIDGQLLARFELAREVISSVRNVRNQKNLPQKEALTLKVIADENYPAEYAPVMRKMANLTAIETVTEKDPAAAAFIVKTTQYFVPMAGKIDAEAERRKLTDELSYQEGFLASVMKKLSNERFMQSAPEKVVANERAKQADAEAKIAAIKAQLEALS